MVLVAVQAVTKAAEAAERVALELMAVAVRIYNQEELEHLVKGIQVELEFKVTTTQAQLVGLVVQAYLLQLQAPQ
jgi:hypothetical protein